MTELILWGRKNGAEEWQEELLLSNATQAQINKVKPLAAADGYGHFRTARIDMTVKPDFACAIN